jgi:DNA repair protein RecO (recombination protein O)
MTEAGLPSAAFVLHARRYRESSLLLDLLTRDGGRVACVARGALQAKRDPVRLQPFQSLRVNLRGRGEVRTLAGAENSAPPIDLRGRRLYCGLYVNELVLYLTAREDPLPILFDAYATTLATLADRGAAVEPALRRFEVGLLQQIGTGPVFDRDSDGRPIDPGGYYLYDLESGPVPATETAPDSVRGVALLALHAADFGDAGVLDDARRLMRRIVHHHLEGRPLKSRELFGSGGTT